MGFLDNLSLQELNKNLKVINMAGKTVNTLRTVQTILTVLTVAFAGYKFFMLVKNNGEFSSKSAS
ncbi:MAG: hypothetical protein LBS36_02475 [Oscillospiraceae bacterium]|jgi:hypothetical protein|nr:hypothetical protein [Oscillospiraceae bacterium]